MKDVKDPPGAPMLIGTECHKALELRVTEDRPVPKTIRVKVPGEGEVYEPADGWNEMMDRVLQVPGKVYAEQQIALDENLNPTSWFDKRTWLRVVVDLAIRGDDKALALDYKTGKRKPDSDQLMLTAAVLMSQWEEVEKVVTGFLWLKTRQIDKETYTRKDTTSIWANFLPRVRRLELAHETGRWDKNPSGLCKRWCPVRDCKFNGYYTGR